MMSKEVIIKKIKSNRRYINNEDLLEEITKEVSMRLDNVLPFVNDDVLKNSLIDKTVSKVIIDILKKHKRIQSHTRKFQKINYKVFDTVTEKHNSPKISIKSLKQLYTVLKKSDENDNTIFLEMIHKIYSEKKTLQELSNLMNIAENDIVDILFDMSKYSGKVMQV